MKAKILGLLAVGILVGPLSANAFSLTYATDVSVSSINGLDIDGTTYDVSFGFGTDTTFFGNETGAFAASTAIADALNTSPARFVYTGGNTTIAYILIGPSYSSGIANDSGSAGSWAAMIPFNRERTSPIVFFTAVPEPASLALLGVGLAGLGLSRRRKAA